MINCPKCNAENEDDAVYCIKCGYQVTEHDQNLERFWRIILTVIAMIIIVGASIFLLDHFLNSMIMAAAQKHNLQRTPPG